MFSAEERADRELQNPGRRQDPNGASAYVDVQGGQGRASPDLV